MTNYREMAAQVIAIAIVLAAAALLAMTYIGHSPGPYGVCYGSSGRSIPCELTTGSGRR